jgi:hypothetical protein
MSWRLVPGGMWRGKEVCTGSSVAGSCCCCVLVVCGVKFGAVSSGKRVSSSSAMKHSETYRVLSKKMVKGIHEMVSPSRVRRRRSAFVCSVVVARGLLWHINGCGWVEGCVLVVETEWSEWVSCKSSC